MADTPDPIDQRLDAAIIFALIFVMVAALGILAFVNIPAQNQTLFTTVVTGIVGFIGIYVGFRWGTSKSSAAKDATIASVVKGDGQ